MWEPGTLVECVDAKPSPGCEWGAGAPLEGAHYTVTTCFVDDEGVVIVHLLEIQRDVLARLRWGPRVGYGARRFRPLSSTGMKMLRETLAKVPDADQIIEAMAG